MTIEADEEGIHHWRLFPEVSAGQGNLNQSLRSNKEKGSLDFLNLGGNSIEICKRTRCRERMLVNAEM